MKKKLSGTDEAFRNSIINAWKAGFFLDESEIKKSNTPFEEREKKFQDAFYKSRVIDLVIEIENGNLNLMPQGQKNNINNDLFSKQNDDEKVNFLVEQLFNGACVADKNNATYLKFSNQECNEYSKSDLQQKLKLINKKLKLIDKKIRLCPKAVFIYDENKGFVKIIDWLISEIENGNLKLVLLDQENNIKNDLSSKSNNDEKVNFLVAQLFVGAYVADENNITYLKFSDKEYNEHSKSNLQEKLKLIDKKIQFCPKAAKIFKPSDYADNFGEYYDYNHLKQERLSELLYFESDEQKRDYIYLRENKDYYRDYVLHQDYGENELYNKLYQCTQKADFGKYKREHFIFDKNGTIIGMDVFAYFADEIVSGELILKNKEGKDISDEVKNIDNDLAREVFLMDKLKNDEYSVCDSRGNKIEMDAFDSASRDSITQDLESTIKSLRTMENGAYKVKKDGGRREEFVVNKIAVDNLFNNLSSDDKKSAIIKDFIEMFRAEQGDIEEIVKDTHKETHALILRYALNKIFTEKINPVSSKGNKLIDSYVFDFSQAGCKKDDLVFSKDGRVEYVKSESLPRVLKLDDTKKLELQARNDFIKDCKYDASNNKELQKAKNAYQNYKVSKEDLQAAEDELKNLRANLDSNACANLSNFYDFDSYRDEFLDAYIKFYQDAKIDYEYWCSECAQKFLKDIKEKEEKNNVELANIELKFFKGQAIKQEDLSQYTKENKQGEIEEIKADIELKRFKDAEIKFDDLSQNTQNNRQKEIIEIEFRLLKKKKLENRARRTTRRLQRQKSKLMQIGYRLDPEKINKQTEFEKIDIDGETIFYLLRDFDNQSLKDEINDLAENNVGLYKSKGIPYKLWDSDTKEYHYNELQWKWFKIGLVPLDVFVLSIISFFVPPLQGYLVIKIIFTVVSFVCGCLVLGKGIKNHMGYIYNGEDTYDNLSKIPSNPSKQSNLNNPTGITSTNDPKKKESHIMPLFGDSETNIITGNDMKINNTINMTKSSDSLKIPDQGDNEGQGQDLN